MVHNIKNAKRLPYTKKEKKYLGPFVVGSVTKSNLITPKDPISDTTTKIPIHLSRVYHERKQKISFCSNKILPRRL